MHRSLKANICARFAKRLMWGLPRNLLPIRIEYPLRQNNICYHFKLTARKTSLRSILVIKLRFLFFPLREDRYLSLAHRQICHPCELPLSSSLLVWVPWDSILSCENVSKQKESRSRNCSKFT